MVAIQNNSEGTKVEKMQWFFKRCVVLLGLKSRNLKLTIELSMMPFLGIRLRGIFFIAIRLIYTWA